MVEKRSARKNIMSYKEAEEKLGISMVSKEEREEKKRRQERTVEEIYETEIKTMDIDSWENKRGPRPWEPETMVQRPADAKTRQNLLSSQLREKAISSPLPEVVGHQAIPAKTELVTPPETNSVPVAAALS